VEAENRQAAVEQGHRRNDVQKRGEKRVPLLLAHAGNHARFELPVMENVFASSATTELSQHAQEFSADRCGCTGAINRIHSRVSEAKKMARLS